MSSNQARRSIKKEEEVKERWFFSKNEIEDTPSAADGISQFDELRYRQHAANLIQVRNNLFENPVLGNLSAKKQTDGQVFSFLNSKSRQVFLDRLCSVPDRNVEQD